MFTISFDETPIKQPADIFADSVRQEDIDLEEAAGRMGANNLPVYVKSVTYGRMLFYTLTSTDADNYEELDLSVSAVYKQYNGEFDLTDRQRTILSNSRERLLAFGGSQQDGLAAISDLNAFFVASEATTAVPVSYVVKNLDGSIARISDATSFIAQSCVARPDVVNKRVTVTMDSIKSTSDCDPGDFLDGDENEIRGTVKAFGRSFSTINKDLEENDSSDLDESKSETFTSPNSSTSFTVSGSFYEEDTSFDDDIGDFTHTYSYPDDWKNRTRTVNLSGDSCSIEFKYSIKIADL